VRRIITYRDAAVIGLITSFSLWTDSAIAG